MPAATAATAIPEALEFKAGKRTANIKHFIPKSKIPKLFSTPEAQTKNF